MPAANTDLIRKKKSNFSTTLSSGINNSDTTIPLSSGSGLPTDTAITLTIDRVDADNVATPSKREKVTGVVSTNNLTNCLRGEDTSSAQSHSSGAIVEDIWEAGTWNDLVDWALTEHNQDGSHKKVTGMDNNTAVSQKDSGGTARAILKLNSNNVLELGVAGTSAINSGYLTDSGTANTYAVTCSPVPAAYATGMKITFKATNANSGASTLNVNALGTKTIKRYGTTDLSSGDIAAGQLVTVIYDGTNFLMVSIPTTVPASAMTDAGSYVKPTTDGDEIRAYHSDGTSYVELQNDGTNSKINSGTGHVVLTPASSKLVKTAVLRQDNTTNTYENDSVVLTGYGFIQGDNTINLEEAVTFGVTFAAPPIIILSPLGYRGSTPSGISSFDGNMANLGNIYAVALKNASETGFNVNLRCETGYTFSNTRYIGYSWIAIGVLAG